MPRPTYDLLSHRFSSPIGTIDASAVRHPLTPDGYALESLHVFGPRPTETGPLDLQQPHPASSFFTRLDREICEYLEGERRSFSVPLALRGVAPFARAVLESILLIPYGHVASYGEIALQAGAPGAARAVGTVCARTPISIVVPVHRVVRAGGSMGRYGSTPELKRHLLDLEDDAYRRDRPDAEAPARGSDA